MIETAYAKINLALHVRARRADGYHEIETLFAFAEHGDLLRVMASDDVGLTMTGRFAEELPKDDDNLVVRAGKLLRERAGVSTGAKLHLVKNLPVASGIGGGSADAAAALRLLARFWSVSPDLLPDIAAGLGADVPACFASQPSFGSGTGAELRPMEQPFAGKPVLLANPLKPLATGPVFAGWDGKDRGAFNPGDQASWRNDLTEPAIALVPEIDELLAKLDDMPGAIFTRMSGSGATCFAIFDSDTARDEAATAFPGMWTLATRLR